MTARQQDTLDHGAAAPSGSDGARALVERVDRYCDAAPRLGGRAEEFGPFTLFVREDGGAPYYARPRPGAGGQPAAADVAAVLERQRELGVPQAFEWIGELAPGLRGLLEQAGLTVSEHPLLALSLTDRPAPAPSGSGYPVRLLDADAPELAEAVAAQYLGFGAPGTALGEAGTGELAAEAGAREADGTVGRARARLRSGATVFAAALHEGRPVAAGQHNPVDGASEIVGVATLPAHRRRGLGLAVTEALLADAAARGARTVFLSASDEDVARIYASAGFRPVGTALVAEREDAG
ncbi:GNAT family N-acetyltransferase [Kitasatospora cineracea]|uniref:GNAT family N-acetyltransferase n=1 Tax=Kitasatospora cineracea TaxID=88074 RepID=UPI0033C2D42B